MKKEDTAMFKETLDELLLVNRRMRITDIVIHALMFILFIFLLTNIIIQDRQIKELTSKVASQKFQYQF